MPDNWENVATVLYADGAMIRSQINRKTEDICLILSRTHDASDDNYVITRQQAGEIIYALSKALMVFNEDRTEDE